MNGASIGKLLTRGSRILGMTVLLLLGGCAIKGQPAPQSAVAPETVATTAPPVAPKATLAPVMPAPANLSIAPDLWQRFSQGRHWRNCELTPDVQRWIGRYASKPERFAATIAPAVPLMDYVLTRAQAAGLPSEIMLIPIVESYYRPDARGPGGALGMWQLMPDTAKHFGLAGRGNSDQRLDVPASTDAALRLLKLNAEAFSNNPKLMLAAYNAGAYRLRKALGGRDHASMRSLEGLGLSRTTREYIDKIKALGCLLGEPERFALQLPPFDVGDRLVEFRTPFAVDPRALSARAGVATADLKRWNPSAFARNSTDANAPLLLPALASAAAARAIGTGELPKVATTVVAKTPESPAGRAHKVASGDSLWTISKRYRVRLADLMRWNGLHKRSVLRIGQRLQLQAAP